MRRTHCLFVLLALILDQGGSRADQVGRVAALTPDTASDLAIAWWRWRVTLPELATPSHDPKGHFCDVGQTGATWFLAGFLSLNAQSQVTRRSCTIPPDRRIAFPLVTLERFVHGVTCDEAKMQVAHRVDEATDLFVRLDDVDIPASSSRRAGSPKCVPLPLAPNTSAAETQAALDGFWIILNPLPPGRHILQYGSGFKSDSKAAGQYQNTTYVLDVH